MEEEHGMRFLVVHARAEDPLARNPASHTTLVNVQSKTCPASRVS